MQGSFAIVEIQFRAVRRFMSLNREVFNLLASECQAI